MTQWAFSRYHPSLQESRYGLQEDTLHIREWFEEDEKTNTKCTTGDAMRFYKKNVGLRGVYMFGCNKTKSGFQHTS